VVGKFDLMAEIKRNKTCGTLTRFVLRVILLVTADFNLNISDPTKHTQPSVFRPNV